MRRCAGHVLGRRLPPTLSVKDMREVVAHALAVGLARRLAVAFESGWLRDPQSSLALARHASEHRGAGLQRHSAPASLSVQALKPQHFSGGPSRAFGREVVRGGLAPATSKYLRTLASAGAARCRLALKGGLVLTWAGSDNRSVNADAQSRLAAAPRRSMVAGYVRR